MRSRRLVSAVVHIICEIEHNTHTHTIVSLINARSIRHLHIYYHNYNDLILMQHIQIIHIYYTQLLKSNKCVCVQLNVWQRYFSTLTSTTNPRTPPTNTSITVQCTNLFFELQQHLIHRDNTRTLKYQSKIRYKTNNLNPPNLM